jgi:pyruvate dehydrogenase E1 component
MVEEQQNVFFYLTVMNEAYLQPAMPKGVESGIIKGMYLLEADKGKAAHHLQLLGSGTILREVREAAKILRDEFNVGADVWSVTSFNELRREALDLTRWNMLHPGKKAKVPYITKCLDAHKGPVIASTDYMRICADQVREFVPASFRVLGTDGFGRSDTRQSLRRFFEVDRNYVVLATLTELAGKGVFSADQLSKAIKDLGIDPDKANPITV